MDRLLQLSDSNVSLGPVLHINHRKYPHTINHGRIQRCLPLLPNPVCPLNLGGGLWRALHMPTQYRSDKKTGKED